MIDQVHNLRGAKEDKPFYILADLFDATKAAQLWCGTADLIAYLHRQQTRAADESLAQIRRRVLPCVDLMQGVRAGGGGEPLVTVENVRDMFAKSKMKLTGTAVRFLCSICNQPDSGSVGLCVQIMEYAIMLATMRNLPSIDLPLLQEALRCGFSPRRTESLMAKMETDRVARAG